MNFLHKTAYSQRYIVRLEWHFNPCPRKFSSTRGRTKATQKYCQVHGIQVLQKVGMERYQLQFKCQTNFESRDKEVFLSCVWVASCIFWFNVWYLHFFVKWLSADCTETLHKKICTGRLKTVPLSRLFVKSYRTLGLKTKQSREKSTMLAVKIQT